MKAQDHLQYLTEFQSKDFGLVLIYWRVRGVQSGAKALSTTTQGRIALSLSVKNNAWYKKSFMQSVVVSTVILVGGIILSVII